MARLETLLVHRYHCVVTEGSGEPLQVNPLFIVSVEPTEAVPETVKVPVADGNAPTAAVAVEKAGVEVMVLVAVTRMRI